MKLSAKVDELMTKAVQSLKGGALFEAERLAEKAFSMARQEQDFLCMAKLCARLMEIRQQRRDMALRVGRITIVDAPFDENIKVEPGCYLVQPPLVGSDARRLRLAAMMREVPVAVLCREPLTQTRLVPIVAISPGSTLRTKIPAMRDAANPDVEWFADAMEELGDSSLELLDPTLPVLKRIEILIDDLDALPEHCGIHEALKAACEEAHAHALASAPKSSTRSKIKM
jgi:hypothetical protein